MPALPREILRPKDAQSIAFSIVPRQERRDSCGEAVVSGIVSLAMAGSPEAGAGHAMSLSAMKAALERRSIPSMPYRMRFDDLPRALGLSGAMVAHLEAPVPHYLLLLAAAGDSVVAADPAEGLRVLSRKEFVSRWSGAVLVPALAGLMHAAGSAPRVADSVRLALERAGTLVGLAGGRAEPAPGPTALSLEAEAGGGAGIIGLTADLGRGLSLGSRIFAGTGAQAGKFRAALRFDLGLSASAAEGLWFGADCLTPSLSPQAAATLDPAWRLSLRAGAWALEDPLAWRTEAYCHLPLGWRESPWGEIVTELSGSVLFAVNARTALTAGIRAEAPGSGGFSNSDPLSNAPAQSPGEPLRAWVELGFQRAMGKAVAGAVLRMKVSGQEAPAITGAVSLRVDVARRGEAQKLESR